MNKYKVCVYGICKNEEKFVKRWYESMKEADAIFVLDTGSTDNTVKLLKEFGVNVRTSKIEPWRFDVARNKSLDLIPDDYDICVCTDLDEVFEKGWRKYLEDSWVGSTSRARYNYNWSLDDNNRPLVNFYIDKIHQRKNYKWTHPVHEVLTFLGDKENIIAIIGDGSLSGGEALEGLNVAGSEINSNLIIIVNDNEQSIAEVHGGMYKNLAELRETGGTASNNLFKAFGLDYIYEENGNDIASLISLFRKVKDTDHPIVVHIHTQKGKGYEIAEKDKEGWHWCMPFDRETGKPTISFGDGEDYTSITAEYIMQKAKSDSEFLVITPAMPGSAGLNQEQRKELGLQYVDVGIAEEQAVAMASGAAKNGAKPLVVTNTTFIQRAYDQISHDVCINNSSVTILLNYNSFDSLTDVTHLGIFGLAAYTNVPNLVVLAPTSKDEYLAMLDWSVDQKKHPIMILIPGNQVTYREADKDFNRLNHFKVEEAGEKVAILALGDFYQRGEQLSAKIKAELGFTPTLINPRFASGIDKELLESLSERHQMVITMEDGILSGGFGEKIASFYGSSDMKVKNYGLEKKFYDRYDPNELLKEVGMTPVQIIADICNQIK